MLLVRTEPINQTLLMGRRGLAWWLPASRLDKVTSGETGCMQQDEPETQKKDLKIII